MGFKKRKIKTPRQEIIRAEWLKKEYYDNLDENYSRGTWGTTKILGWHLESEGITANRVDEEFELYTKLFFEKVEE